MIVIPCLDKEEEEDDDDDDEALSLVSLPWLERRDRVFVLSA